MSGRSKSSIEQIRERFDHDVERFSNLETGQSATVDAALALNLIAEAAAACTPHAKHILDIGCGAGNFTLRVMQQVDIAQVTLIDLSRPMLDRAVERIADMHNTEADAIQGDIRETALKPASCDIVLAGAVLHHLRTDEQWAEVFSKIYQALRPGGSFWIFDMIKSSTDAVEAGMWRRYGEYLTAFKDEAYRDHVFAYIEQEDTPRPLMEQLELLRRVGFDNVEILHKHSCFAAFGGVKRS